MSSSAVHEEKRMIKYPIFFAKMFCEEESCKNSERFAKKKLIQIPCSNSFSFKLISNDSLKQRTQTGWW